MNKNIFNINEKKKSSLDSFNSDEIGLVLSSNPFLKIMINILF
jgi:hypothetical protein